VLVDAVGFAVVVFSLLVPF